MFYIYYKAYKYKVLSFKLTNKLATYQQYINDVLFNYLNDFYITYFNNILIYLNDIQSYYKYINKVL